MELKNTSEFTIEALHEAFLSTYSDYVIPTNPDLASFKRILAQRGFNSALSHVATIDGEIAGFWLFGSSEKNRNQIYTIAVGTRPDYRRRRLSAQIATHAFEVAKQHQIKQVVLECISSNRVALNSYSQLGFIQQRKLDCFELSSFPTSPNMGLKLEMHRGNLNIVRPEFEEFRPSWQNTEEATARSENEIVTLIVRDSDEVIGICKLNVKINVVATLAVHPAHRRQRIGTSLLYACLEVTRSPVKLLNTDASNQAWRHFMKSVDANYIIQQLELLRTL